MQGPLKGKASVWDAWENVSQNNRMSAIAAIESALKSLRLYPKLEAGLAATEDKILSYNGK